MSQPSPEFRNPPVAEVVLGVQFAPLAGLTSGHLGWLWKGYLGEGWVNANDAPPLPDQFETFEGLTRLGRKWVHFQLEPAGTPRLQVSNDPRDRQIQVQSSRLHYNWLRKGSPYPRYDRVLEEFEHHWDQFARFVTEAKLGPLLPNQWELTYVNLIPRGELWQTPDDWHQVLPGLLAPDPGIEGLITEGVGGEWHYEITPRRGRLHMSVGQSLGPGKDEPVLAIKTTTRGPVGKEGVSGWKEGLDLGHAATVAHFLRITSEKAQQHWGIQS